VVYQDSVFKDGSQHKTTEYYSLGINIGSVLVPEQHQVRRSGFADRNMSELVEQRLDIFGVLLAEEQFFNSLDDYRRRHYTSADYEQFTGGI
jgi:hypothetical protein